MGGGVVVFLRIGARQLADCALDPVGRRFFRSSGNDLERRRLWRVQAQCDTSAIDELGDQEAALDITVVDRTPVEHLLEFIKPGEVARGGRFRAVQ